MKRRKIYVFNNTGARIAIYNSISEAARELNILQPAISRAIKMGITVNKTYRFAYAENNVARLERAKLTNARPVACYCAKTGVTLAKFKSFTAAEKSEYGGGEIKRSVKTQKPINKKRYIWKYI